MKTYRVYFSDGNKKLYTAPNMLMLCQRIETLSIYNDYGVNSIVKIEEVKA